MNNNNNELLRVTVPNPLHKNSDEFNIYNIQVNSFVPLFNLARFSHFDKICKVSHFVRKFIHKLKMKVHEKHSHLFPNVDLNSECSYSESCNVIIRQCQQESFLETYNHLKNPRKNKETFLLMKMRLLE